jgi:hypothetical protein
MSLVIRETTKTFTPVPAGSHLAVCVLVADLGLQNDSKYKPRSKIYLRWELVGQTATWRDKHGNEMHGPMLIGKSYTQSLAPKSNLRADLESWRGRSFTDAEIKAFDAKSLLGKCCTLGVVHREDGEKTYANIGAVMGAPKDAAPTATSKLVAFDVDDWNESAFQQLPSWLQQQILERMDAQPPAAPQQTKLAATTADQGFNDEIPF